LTRRWPILKRYRRRGIRGRQACRRGRWPRSSMSSQIRYRYRLREALRSHPEHVSETGTLSDLTAPCLNTAVSLCALSRAMAMYCDMRVSIRLSPWRVGVSTTLSLVCVFTQNYGQIVADTRIRYEVMSTRTDHRTRCAVGRLSWSNSRQGIAMTDEVNVSSW